MAQLIIAAAGAAIGGALLPAGVAIGGFAIGGAQLGWIGGSLLGSMFAPTQKSQGPRLGDLRVTGSAYGAVLPYCKGSPRLAPQVIWASSKREIATTTSQGKGSGGSEYTSYTYEVDLLLEVSENIIPGGSRVWINGKLVWNSLGAFDTLVASANSQQWTRMTVYTGDPAQLPDPTYEAAVGTANAPAYRGRGTVMLQGLQLGSSGQVPNIEFELAGTQANLFTCLQHFNGPTVLTYQGTWAPDPTFRTQMTYTFAAAVGPSWTLDSVGSIQNIGHIYNDLSVIRAPGILGAGAFYNDSLNPTATVLNSASAWLTMTSAFAVPAGGDFTIEFTHDPLDPTYGAGLYSGGSTGTCVQGGNWASTNSWQINNTYSGTGRYYQFSHISGGGLNGPDVTGRTQVRVTRASNVTRMFYNGALVASTSSITAALTGTGYLNVGSRGPGSYVIDQSAPGVYDEFLYIAGFALSTAAFTPSTVEYPASIVTGSYSPPTVASVATELLQRTGLSAGQFDVTDLAAITLPVRALKVGQVSSTQAVLAMLASCYFFDSCGGDKIYFRRRGSAAVVTIPFADLGADGGSEPFAPRLANELEVPAQMALTYDNIENDWQTDTQYSDRLLSGQTSVSVVQVPLGFYASEAKQIVDAWLMDKLIGMTTAQIAVDRRYAQLQPTDVVLVVDEAGNTWRMRIVKAEDTDGVLKFDLVLDDASVFTQAGTTTAGTQAQTVVLAPAATTLLLLDIPLLQDVDNLPGLYAAVQGNGAGWKNAAIFDSVNGSTYTQQTALESQAVFGTATTALTAYAGGNAWDAASTLTVNVGTGTLSSYLRSDIIAGTAPGYLVGNELVYALTATLVSTGIYTLSNFLRGRKGTEWAMSGHAIGDRFCVLQPVGSGLRYLQLQSTELGVLRYYKAASAGQRLSAVTALSVTPTGIPLKPLSPFNLRANRDAADTVLTWQRRTRLSNRFLGSLGSSVPLGEASESYSIEVYDATYTTLKRTITATTPTATYTAAQQTTDFGGAQTVLYLRVYQISATVGRGYVLQAST